MTKTHYIQIQETTDYDLFVNVLGNRAVDDLKVRKLIESIKNKNLLEFNEINVNERTEK